MIAKPKIMVINKTSQGGTGLIPGMGIKQLSFTSTDALEDELVSFVEAVKRREAPEVTGQMGRNALQIALSIMEQINITRGRFLS